jgi:hypothetical protein
MFSNPLSHSLAVIRMYEVEHLLSEEFTSGGSPEE